MLSQMLKSKTLIVNVLTAVGTFLALPDVLNLLAPEHVVYIVYAQSVVNFLLRLATTQPVMQKTALFGTGDGTAPPE